MTLTQVLLVLVYSISVQAIACEPLPGDPIFVDSGQLLGESDSRAVVLGDVDGDGDLDAATGNADTEDEIWINQAGIQNGIPGFFRKGQDIEGGGKDIALGDLDQDGDLDIVTASRASSSILFNQGGAQLGSQGFFVNSRQSLQEADDLNFVILADVDGDGDLDIVGPNKIWLNQGGVQQGDLGSFQLGYAHFGAIALGDLDGDRDLDAISEGAIWLNQGGVQKGLVGDFRIQGQFDSFLDQPWHAFLPLVSQGETQSIMIHSESDQSSVADSKTAVLGDIDSDGDLDLLSLSPIGGTVSPTTKVWVNQGGLQNGQPGNFVQSMTPPMSGGLVVLGDIDGDSDLDAVVDGHIWLNQGGFQGGQLGFFIEHGSAIDYSAAYDEIALGDLDGDGDLDIFTARGFPDYGEPNRVWFNQGGNTFLSCEAVIDLTRFGGGAVALGDLDNDEDLDAFITQSTKPVWINQGEQQAGTPGTFKPNDVTINDQTGEPVRGPIALGDVDGDNDLDAFTPDSTNAVWINQGGLQNGILATFQGSGQNLGTSNSSDIALGDLDGDGDLDAYVASDRGVANGSDKIWINQGGAQGSSPGFFSASLQEFGHSQIQDVDLGDLDQDGDLDAFLVSFDGIIQILLNQADYTFIQGQHVQTDAAIWASALGDLDGDGDLDAAIVYLFHDSNFGNIWINQGGFQDGIAGTFKDSGQALDVRNGRSQDIALGDLDSDGDLDAIVGKNWVGIFQPAEVWQNLGGTQGGTLGIFHKLATQGTKSGDSVALGDLDSDGDLDALFNYNIYLGKSEGNTQIKAYVTTPGRESIANFYSTPFILESPTISISFKLLHPNENALAYIRAYYSLDGGGSWQLAVATQDTIVNNLTAGPSGSAHIYTWDTFSSGIFGLADNVVFRIDAFFQPVPSDRKGVYSYPNVVAASSLGVRASARTLPFRVRGSQVRVFAHTSELQNHVRNAVVYQLPAGQDQNALPIMGGRDKVFRTDSQGYLQGRGRLAPGDRLVALLPITSTASYTVYNSSALPTLSGLDTFTITQPGIQQLVVSANNPLILFNLVISLEWDARNDPTFMTQLENDIKRAAQILYDLTNGQAALGEVRIYHDKGFWGTANVVIVANNSQRPSAIMGGSVLTPTADIDSNNNPIPDAYVPGQVRIGVTWNRFGNPSGTIGEDWPRVLAHELSHYLFFLADDYIGVTPDRKLVKLVDCQGSAMTDPYDESYSELLSTGGWTGDCLDTLMERYLGRSDWETIRRFYPMLNGERINPGPSQLPLAVTQIKTFAPITPTNTLAAPFFNLVDGNNTTIPIPDNRGRAYLFKTQGNNDPTDDHILALGTPIGDLVQARGAAPGDRLCVFDYSRTPLRLGCLDSIGITSSSVVLHELANWQPQIQVSGLTTNTIVVTVTNVSASNLSVQLLPSLGVASGEIAMTQHGADFVQTVTAADGAYYGFVRIWVPGSNPRQEMMIEYTAIEAWNGRSRAWGTSSDAWGGRSRAWGVPAYAWGGRSRAWGAPVMSGDGQVSIFPLDNPFASDAHYTLQSIASPPALPSWLTPVGQAYRVSGNTSTPASAILFSYLAREVPSGYEEGLHIYYSADDGQTWQPLTTELDINRNQASAAVAGAGIYVLIVTVKGQPLVAGWNLFGYPVQTAQPVAEALASVTNQYSIVYAYDPTSPQPWRAFDPNVQSPFGELVNTLNQLEFGLGYWIYATQPVTPYFAIASSSAAVVSSDLVGATTAGSPSAPATYYGSSATVVSSDLTGATTTGSPSAPATYYGWITPTVGFTPIVGMHITAKVNGVVCGETQTQLVAGKLAYVLRVAARDPGVPALPCGEINQEVIFYIDNRIMDHNHLWDNRQTWFHSLSRVR